MKLKYISIVFICASIISGCSSNILPEEVANAATPSKSLASMSEKSEKLSEYTTKFNKEAGRLNNIKLSADAIDNAVINPGEEFSFNGLVGMTTAEKGYKKATVFFKGKEEKEYGGGICQVSSTLYNAALEAGLEITERHAHSKKVRYVPDGRDAATSYGTKDFKFTNNFDYPVKINTYVGENTVTTEILKEASM